MNFTNLPHDRCRQQGSSQEQMMLFSLREAICLADNHLIDNSGAVTVGQVSGYDIQHLISPEAQRDSVVCPCPSPVLGGAL